MVTGVTLHVVFEQGDLARALHEEARVPVGPCGLDQIKLFEIILDEYQFGVVSVEHGHAIVHNGPQSTKQIVLLMHDGHFDVITKLPGFFNSNYFCLRCEKAYCVEDYDHHTCRKTKFHAFFQANCPDYEIFKHTNNPDLLCKDCGRHFYGVTCQVNHLTRKVNGHLVAHDEKNVCKSHKKCSICLHAFSSSAQEHMKHCGLQKCPSCSEKVNILQHKCYLKPVKHIKRRRKRNNDEKEEQLHTVFIYFDIEAQQDTGNHVANLVCAETDQNNVQFTFKEQCIQEFLQWVHTMANQHDVEEVIVVAHNFKWYYGYFILEELYKQHVTNLSQVVN